MMLGNADVLADLQIDIDELKEKVEKLELEYEVTLVSYVFPK